MFDSNEMDSIIQHMNEDHADAVLSYARAFTDYNNITAANMLLIDASGIDLSCSHEAGHGLVRILFPSPLLSSGQARSALVNLVKTSRTIEKVNIGDESPYAPIDCGAYDYIEIACTYHYHVKLDLLNDLSLTGLAQTTRTVKGKGEFLLLEVSGAKISVRLDSIVKITALTPDAQFQTQAIL